MEEREEVRLNRNFLIAVDDSDNSRRAVRYAGYLLGKMEGVHVTLLHVIPDPEEDYFPEEEQKRQWLERYRQKMEAVMDAYRDILLENGLAAGSVEKRMPVRYCPSMAECILAEHDERRYGTIVVGRQGLSRQEQFLFGSISSKIVNHARRCTVWVVE